MIRVNGEPAEWRPGMTVREVLAASGFVFHTLIVRVDGALVKPSEYGRFSVPDGAEVQVIHMMTGG